MSKGMIGYKYDPDYKAASWASEVEFEHKNLSIEDTQLAYKIIYEKEIVGLKGFYELLDRLAKAGFRGEIINRAQLFLPPLIVLNSKVDKDK